ncbi:GntR family transcriptional regulator [Pollutimonas bauzanensis]|uniref:DNA-binding transcriptional regulator, GntR family n=1 Tax=Pollutimonas bauzanensis TaxID=658167 RepID=A0A1M5VKP8_9BURK|nr:GntR family transcriptional regulator [Pollutimonas bauzanensis]SHH75842.1 DNA-binding transcriptional regulator, GntR family [Pollutimonas bauzanensis]
MKRQDGLLEETGSRAAGTASKPDGIDRNSGATAAAITEATIVAEIEDQLCAGTLRPGDRINESAYAARMGCSRGLIREALRTLEHLGLVRSELNRGVVVIELSAKEALDIYDLRASLFSLACKISCAKASTTWVQNLGRLVDLMDKAVEEDNIDAYYPINVSFHNLIIERSENSRLIDFWKQLERQLHLFRRRGLVSPGAMRLSNSEHRRMVEAFSSGDIVALEALAYRHIKEGKMRLLTSVASSI